MVEGGKRMSKGLGIFVAVLAVTVVVVAIRSGSPTASAPSSDPIDATAGYTHAAPVVAAEVVRADDGMLEAMIPKLEFACSGVLLDKRKDRQDGFEYSLTLAFGRLAETEVFAHLADDGSVGRRFSDGFVLDTPYFQSHVAAFYVRSASHNVRRAVASLEEGSRVRLRGQLVFLETARGVLETSLDPAEFKCKYAYITQLDTDQASYF